MERDSLAKAREGLYSKAGPKSQNENEEMGRLSQRADRSGNNPKNPVVNNNFNINSISINNFYQQPKQEKTIYKNKSNISWLSNLKRFFTHFWIFQKFVCSDLKFIKFGFFKWESFLFLFFEIGLFISIFRITLFYFYSKSIFYEHINRPSW